MIRKLKSAQFSRIISPWLPIRRALPIQKVNSHGRSWVALRLVWLRKRKKFDHSILNTRHTREVVRIELKQLHRFATSTNQRVEIRQELATVPHKQHAPSRFVHSKSTNEQILLGGGNLIAAKTREQLHRGSTFEPSRQSWSIQHCVTKSDFLTHLVLKYCIQKEAIHTVDSSPSRGLHQDTVYRRVSILRRETGATEARQRHCRKTSRDDIVRPAVSRFEFPSGVSSPTLRQRFIQGNASSLPVSSVALRNKPIEANGSNRMELTQPVEIVWRTEQRKNSSHNSSNFDSQSVSSESSTKTKPKSNAESTTVLNSKSTRTITMLDPAIVDRLTEDIIRRVERKIRIDRERRGVGG